ncbi:hypothetical protein [Helicobacter sp. MIT 01-3238]|nr:hypothetical protein [Helicobacter sp. MIT 01-3238]
MASNKEYAKKLSKTLQKPKHHNPRISKAKSNKTTKQEKPKKYQKHEGVS